MPVNSNHKEPLEEELQQRCQSDLDSEFNAMFSKIDLKKSIWGQVGTNPMVPQSEKHGKSK